MSADVDPALRAHYEKRHEQGRLADGAGRLEFERTVEILERHLPAPPARVADIGGGPGRYALWLANGGYAVEHRDLLALHVEQLRAELSGSGTVCTAVADARALDLPARSVDAVLLLGPLYHLPERADRVAALAEATRVVVPGGVVVVAVISRFSVRLETTIRHTVYRDHPEIEPYADEVEATGVMAPLVAGGFTAYLHRPDEIVAEIADAGLDLVELLAVEGPAAYRADIETRMADPIDRAAILTLARALERVPETLGASPHLIAIARAQL